MLIELQIRVLLIDCLVMTNLFYPALSIYLQEKFPPLHPPAPPSHNTHRHSPSGSSAASYKQHPKEHPLSLLSTSWLDSFFPYPPPLLPPLRWAGWWGRDTGQQSQDEWVVRGLPPELGEEEVHLMRVAWADVGDVLNQESEEEEYGWINADSVILDLVRSTAEGWEEIQSEEGCVRELKATADGTVEPSGDCIVISPDSIPANSVTLSQFTLRMSATDESPDLRPFNWPPAAGRIYRSVGLLMRMPKGSADSFEARWSDAMGQIASKVEGEVFIEVSGPASRRSSGTTAWGLTVSRRPKC